MKSKSSGIWDIHLNPLLHQFNRILKKHINIPDTASYELNAAYHELSEIPADKFDKAYCIKMESAHNSAIEVFERASRECIDTDIKKMAEGIGGNYFVLNLVFLQIPSKIPNI